MGFNRVSEHRGEHYSTRNSSMIVVFGLGKKWQIYES